jgi:toxin ParE1/3/4
MSLPYILIPQAQMEFDESFDHYERERPGLGVEFLSAIRTMLQHIAANPQFYAVVHRNVREAIVPRFPFCIYYVHRSTCIRVLSIFHTSRDPQVWQGRR